MKRIEESRCFERILIRLDDLEFNPQIDNTREPDGPRLRVPAHMAAFVGYAFTHACMKLARRKHAHGGKPLIDRRRICSKVGALVSHSQPYLSKGSTKQPYNIS